MKPHVFCQSISISTGRSIGPGFVENLLRIGIFAGRPVAPAIATAGCYENESAKEDPSYERPSTHVDQEFLNDTGLATEQCDDLRTAHVLNSIRPSESGGRFNQALLFSVRAGGVEFVYLRAQQQPLVRIL